MTAAVLSSLLMSTQPVGGLYSYSTVTTCLLEDSPPTKTLNNNLYILTKQASDTRDIANQYGIFNRPGVAGAVLQTPL